MPNDKASPAHTGFLTKTAQSFPDKLGLSAGWFEISHSCPQELIAVLRSGDVVVLPFPNSIEAQADSDSTVVVLFYVHGFLARLLPPLSAGRSVTQASLSQFSASTFWGDMHKPGSVDKPVGQELVVLNDKGVPQPTGVAGEVCIRGPNVTKGYKNNPEANEAAFLFGRLHTGDLGYLDEDGYLHLVGRVKELINNGVPAVDISPPEGSEHNTGSGPRDELLIDIPLPEGSEHNTGSGPRDEVPIDIPPPEGSEHNTGSGPRDEVPIDIPQPEESEHNTGSEPIADPNSAPNRSNEIWELMYITGCNFVSNATVGILYLGENLQGSNAYQRAELIASVGAPIAVAAGTFVASILFASNPGRWSKWISGMSVINAAMTVGGPLSFNWVRN